MKGMQHIHHISAIVGDPQETLDFYQGVLGLRLVKQTVNFDDKNTYHLYFARKEGRPEGSMTFFNWTNPEAKGVVGSGQVGRIAFRIPKGSLEAWKQRLTGHGIAYDLTDLFAKETLEFTDYHQLALALVEGEDEADSFDIQGFHGTVILAKDAQASAQDLESFIGLKAVEGDDDYWHFESLGDKAHRILVKKDALPIRRLGIGTVHHVAWWVADREELKEWERALDKGGYRHSGLKDRKYFHSIYYREPGSVVFEIATDGPGFTVDEELDELGQELQLPEMYEGERDALEAQLPQLKL